MKEYEETEHNIKNLQHIALLRRARSILSGFSDRVQEFREDRHPAEPPESLLHPRGLGQHPRSERTETQDTPAHLCQGKSHPSFFKILPIVSLCRSRKILLCLWIWRNVG